jgi:hypothetical protein
MTEILVMYIWRGGCALNRAIRLGNISYSLGHELKFLGDYEKFANDPEADIMLSRNYRKPYVVPDQV